MQSGDVYGLCLQGDQAIWREVACARGKTGDWGGQTECPKLSLHKRKLSLRAVAYRGVVGQGSIASMSRAWWSTRATMIPPASSGK